MFRVLHILDHSLPLQSGYTFRTRAILKAQQADGFEVRAVTGLRHKADGPDHEEVDGLAFRRTRGVPGLAREWGEITALTDAISAQVRDWRPDALVVSSRGITR